MMTPNGEPSSSMGVHVSTWGRGGTDRSTRGILTQGKLITLEDMKGTPGVHRTHEHIITITTITIITNTIIVPTTWTDKKFVTHCP